MVVQRERPGPSVDEEVVASGFILPSSPFKEPIRDEVFVDRPAFLILSFVAALLSVITLILFLILSSVTGNSDYLAALAFTQVAFVTCMMPKLFWKCFLLYTRVKVFHVVSAIGIALAIQLFSTIFHLLDDVPVLGVLLNWSWLNYLSSDEDLGGNSITFGFKYLWTAILFFILLVFTLPVLAFFEEIIFRRGTKNWKSGIKRSLLFGLMHLTAGAPVGICVFVLSAVGMIFTREYFEGLRRAKLSAIVSKALHSDIESKSDNQGLAYVKNRIQQLESRKFSKLMNKVGLTMLSFRLFSIGTWNSMLHLSCEEVVSASLENCGDKKIQFDPAEVSSLEEIPLCEGYTASTIIHMMYNLVVISAYFLSLLVSRF